MAEQNRMEKHEKHVRSGAHPDTAIDASLTQRTDLRNLLICIAAVATAMLVVWPFADIGYGDDVAYSHVALTLSQTAHIVYNGWEAALLLQHVYWGALFIKLFGFSFVGLRLSTMPFALGAVGLCYLLVRRAGLRPSSAVLVTLLLGLSPLFLPVSVSYMTDVPGLFFVFASMYSFTRAAETSGGSRGYVWLVLGVATGFIGGTGRQVAWFVPLAVLPYLAWVRRRETWFVVSSLAAWIMVVGSVLSMESWFNQQLYSAHQPSLLAELKRDIKGPLSELNITARLGLMLLLFSLPASVPLVLRATIDTWEGPRGRQILVAALLLLLLAAIVIHPSLASIPWVSSTLNWEGINGSAPLPGRPIVLVRPIRAVVAVTVYVATCLLAGEFWTMRRLVRGAVRPLLDPSNSEFALATMSLFSVSYLALMIIRGVDFDVFDRYLLPIVPWAATVLLLWFESYNPNAERMLRGAMPFAWVLLAVLAFYAIASTQDLWALAKARVVAAQKLESAGVARTAIDAGFEYNFWTELMINGRINSRWVVNPPGAYNPNESQTPSVVPIYRLEYASTPETAPSEFGSVPYFSILPPFHKQVCIDRILKR